MHATVRRYEGVTDQQEATNRVQKGFVPLISAIAGFIAYYWVDLGYGAMLSVNVFDSLSNVSEANKTAERWIRASLASLLKQDPRTEAGEVVAQKRMAMASRALTAAGPAFAAKPGMASAAVADRAALRLKPHLTLRRYEGVTDPLEAARQVRESFVPVIATLPGFSAYYWVALGHAAMLSVSVFDSFAHGVESGQTAAIWVRANLAGVLPQNPRVESGRVVAMA